MCIELLMNEIRNIPHYLEKDILAKESNATCCHTQIVKVQSGDFSTLKLLLCIYNRQKLQALARLHKV